MRKLIIACLPLLLLIAISLQIPLRADTIKLVEGSILVGKIIKEDKKSLEFTNAYGTFQIKKIHIVDIYKTNDYTEDIEILKKMDRDVNAAEIKKNVEAGQVKKEIREKMWVNGRISVSGSFNYVFGRVGGKLPYGYSGHLALDQGLDMALGRRHPLMPGLRFEGGYLNFHRGSYAVSGFNAGGGLMWAVPSMKNRGGCFVFAMMPGASLLDITNSESGGRAKSYTFTAQAIAGYQVSFGVFSMFFHARYTYIYDRNVLFNTIGAEAGFGFNAW
ncbi:MAG: hypothetical protein A2W19_09015 [Spirochaetes bacterium RBG_16_49_21]|nr:MAG: hypothetical protein A2W19_09015 [Spirochaetes bacterium RBG_16_49_21]